MSSIQRQELILKKMKERGIEVGSGISNKKSRVAFSTKNEAIFFGLANSFNNEIIVSLSFIKKGRNPSSLDLLFKMYKSKWDNSKKSSLRYQEQLDV